MNDILPFLWQDIPILAGIYEVLAIEPGFPGPKSDKRLYEGSQAAKQYLQAARRADLAYVGVPEMLLPRKKPRGRQLTLAQGLFPLVALATVGLVHLSRVVEISRVVPG